MILTKILSLFLCFSLILEQGLFAQTIDLSRYFANSGKSVIQSDKFRPLHLRYISYDNQANDFKILLDKGDFFNRQTPKLEEATQELMKYFFIGLSLPNEKFWVNLRPDSPDNILDPDLEKTDIGRIFLEADLQLKKDTSGMTSPQTPEGKAYWDKLYKKAGELFNSQNITIPTITRPWIVPGETIIGESPEGAYIYKATLKVMLEEDYLTSRGGSRTAPTYQQYAFSDPRLKELNEYSTRQIKETIIPKLTYEVNTSKRYARLRQVYYSLILAQWFKQKYGSAGSVRAPGTSAPANNYIDLIDSGNLANLASKEPYDKQAYFRQYQKSFADGEYNLQEPMHTPAGQSIRRYISGGVLLEKAADSAIVYPGKNQPTQPMRDYLISPTLSSPINTERIAKELTEALFDTRREDERLFVWGNIISPAVLKQILKNIENDPTLNEEYKQIKLRDLIIRIITDSAEMKNDTEHFPSKTQKQLLIDIINNYLSVVNKLGEEEERIINNIIGVSPAPIDITDIRDAPDGSEIKTLKDHITNYLSRFEIKDAAGKTYYKESLTTIFHIVKEMRKSLKNQTPFSSIYEICRVLYQLAEKGMRINDLLEQNFYSDTIKKRLFRDRISYLKMRKLELQNWDEKPTIKFTAAEGEEFSLKLGEDKKFRYYWNPNNKENILYLRNKKNDIWLIFYKINRENKFFIGWFNEDINEFEFSDEDILLPADGIIDLTQLTRYAGVKRLLSSSSLAAQTDKDPDIQNLRKFITDLLKRQAAWNLFYKKAAKNTEKTQKEAPIKINGHNYYVRSNLQPPLAKYLTGVVIITGGLTGRKFVLKRTSPYSRETEIHKELSAKGISVPNILSLTDELDKKYLLMDYIEGEEINIQLYNSDGPSNKLKYLFKLFNKKGVLDSFIKDINEINKAGISHNDLANFRNLLFAGNRIVFIDFGLAEKNVKKPDNAKPLINNLKALIQEAEEGLKNNKNAAAVKRYIEFANTMISRFSSSPAFNSPASDKGGIDFSRPEIITRPASGLQSLADGALVINPNLDFEGEWRGIQMVFNAGIRPSARRMAEFAVSTSASPLNSQRLEDLRGLVADLLRRDEEDEKPAPADPALKELLAIL